jgi:hypothetical protein
MVQACVRYSCLEPGLPASSPRLPITLPSRYPVLTEGKDGQPEGAAGQGMAEFQSSLLS